ncbi:type IV pilus modification protein PilV [Dyella subtropica]|uniref:type IV pilus modification protein PilV n=1 Tax=Dyella subtropica TaxID=2992127 RepID=UPI002259BB13|nr:type IV pilus modification protein PilV [Dyella subtropica]
MHIGSRQRGVSLIEVMVAVLIFSIGMIGLAGLLMMATRSNHAAYLRTQVVFLASSMMDRMRANPVGVWNGDYNRSDYPAAASITAISACDNQACTPVQLATRDQNLWSSQLTTFLPDPQASIVCTSTGSPGFDPSAPVNLRPPYGGDCTMIIQWAERGAGDTKGHSALAPQRFVWRFQP